MEPPVQSAFDSIGTGMVVLRVDQDISDRFGDLRV